MIRLKNRFGKANRKEMSWMSDLMETLRQEGISPDLLHAVEEYRAAHALPEALRPRIPASVVGIPASESIFSKICSDSDIYASRARDSAP